MASPGEECQHGPEQGGGGHGGETERYRCFHPGWLFVEYVLLFHNDIQQAMAKSVHTSSIFGDNTFGDLPRPRLNTFGKD